MPFRRAQPTPQYLEAVARRALAIHRRYTADPIKTMVANNCDFFWYVQRATDEWPMHYTPYIGCLVNCIMQDVLRNGTPLADAVANVPRAP